ncbi:unnamed protein product [Penicillium camemberti]|uniref:Str. FM013 n=1 Tax=Penicillium camemberti (strain FM 013) TaxID=1429867 RepID=A0A0G4PYB1_PENC3|nr:unnamed protein product [Penicillium camemberti]
MQSLFGMNVNLLETHPGRKWYLLWAGLALLLTGGLWIISRIFPQSDNRLWRKIWDR